MARHRKALTPEEQADRLAELLGEDMSGEAVRELMLSHPELSRGWTVLAERWAGYATEAAATRPARGGGAPRMEIAASALP
jgi:hypothetical protein